ncbi:MAG: GNAT family N-acetyltransferase [Patescibacteria group bacterium]|nr:GNAT family N-acetyltransferase [Patescibacteria group bacterium]
MNTIMSGRVAGRISGTQHGDIIFRYSRWEDLDETLRYANELSREDTFVTLSGETISRDEQMEYLGSYLKLIEKGHAVQLFAFSGTRMIGSSDITRQFTSRMRGHHVGKFGISIAADYRGLGIGYSLARCVLSEARAHITGLRLVILDLIDGNDRAYNLYKRLGFQESGRIPGAFRYHDEYRDKIIMHLAV